MKLIRRRTAAKFSRRPVERSSSTTTSCPAPTRCSTRCDPMNPAPPVIRHRMADRHRISHARRVGRIPYGVGAAREPQVFPPRKGRCRGTSLATPRSRAASVRRGGSPPTAPQDHHRHGAEHDSEIFERRLAANVLEVVAYLAAHVTHRRVVALVDLCPARDARPNALAALVALDLLAQVHKDGGLLGPRADDVHVAHQDVEQLGQLVQAELPQHPAYGRYPPIIGGGPRLGIPRPGREHRAELIHRERLTALIDVATGVAARVRKQATVQPHACLCEQDRPAGGKLDQRRNREQDGEREDEPDGGHGDIEHASAPAFPVTGTLCRATHQRERRSRRSRVDEGGHGLRRAHRPTLSGGQSISKKNRLPQLGRLSTRSSEPIARTSLEQMASPSPELEKWWRPSADAGETGWYGAPRNAGSNPGPVSRTENSSRLVPMGRAVSSTKPLSVNFTALVARFSSVRDTARACPTRRSGTGCTRRTARPFSSAIGSTMLRT